MVRKQCTTALYTSYWHQSHGIFMFVWFHQLSNRVGEEARMRGINSDFSATTFWLWYVLGSLIIVGPFIYVHKLCENMNALSANYNQHGM